MSFVWKIPYQPPDKAAIERMKHHFPKPSELMPYAWFMREVTFIEWLGEKAVEDISGKDLSGVFFEIWSGIESFPNVEYVGIWKEWFKYLLPHAITLMHSDKDNSSNPSLINTFQAFMMIYPQKIADEYPEFRDDVVYTLGTRIIPQMLSRDNPRLKSPDSPSLQNPVFNDIWDFTNSPNMEIPGMFAEFYYPMHFCLKYLNPSEMDTWVESLIKIDSPQWRLAIVTWWLREFYPQISHEAFSTAMGRYLSRDLFQSWAEDIRSHQIFRTARFDFPISEALRTSIDQDLQRFETLFFQPA